MSNIIKENFKLVIYLILWYIFSGYYNILNKNALNILKLPWFVATSITIKQIYFLTFDLMIY
jgi:hypothetical protein